MKEEVAEGDDGFFVLLAHLERASQKSYLESIDDSLHEASLRSRHQIPKMNRISDSRKKLENKSRFKLTEVFIRFISKNSIYIGLL